MVRKIEMVGNKYNNWKVLKQITTTNVKLRYLAKCLLCKEEFEVIGEALRNGKSKQCRKCGTKISAKNKKGKPFKSRYTLEDRKIRHLLRRYKSDCRNRANKQNWNLDYKDFKNLVKGYCYYCKSPPCTTINIYPPSKKVTESLRDNGWVTYNGIDRIDNNKGYEIKNVVTCCKTCNRMKSNLTKEEFLFHIQKIYNTGQTSDQLK